MMSTGESTPSRSNFAMSSPPGSSTVASSPPLLDDDVDGQLPTSKTVPSVSNTPDPIEEQDLEARFTRLNYLLQRSSLYANLLQDQMDRSREKHAAAAIIAETPTPAKRGRGKPKAKPALKKNKGKRVRVDSDDEADGDLIPDSKRAKVEVAKGENGQQDVSEKPSFVQPALLTGATLKDYQLDGVAWMVGLWENGISGILADEMGLGKTIQTIAFIAYLRTRVDSPFLVVCPLSVMHNWIDEFQKFAPDIPVCMYHGSPEERKEMRNTDMSLDKLDEACKVTNTPKKKAASKAQPKKGRPAKAKAKPKAKARQTRRKSTVDSDDELAGFTEDDVEESEAKKEPPAEEPVNSTHQKSMFPVVVTTYEIIIKDRQPLSKIKWGYIVVDEGHRLKNMDCKLMQEIKKYTSAGRMVLTGTPLHNNLAELWSLLHFILPDIFDDVDVFQKWFNLPELSTQLSTDRSSHILQTLHSILKPFLLRRVKADVERSLPPKKEYILYAPLSERQREIYDAIVRHDIRRLLVGARPDLEDEHELREAEDKEKQEGEAAEDEKTDRKLRKQERRNYDVGESDDDDDAYFEALERGRVQDIRQQEPEKSVEQLGKEYAYKTMLKKVNNLHLENVVMQLRKVCSHPFLFDWPLDSRTGQYVVDEQLEDVSGKMMVLERLLEELFKRGHKVLVFSQFTTMLDVIQDWATEFKRWPLCRIDGSSKPMERRREMVRFQTDSPDAPSLFLLSTRAGGLGINLTAADTVVFYDSDWNPQMDLQAADRAHRIGQTKPVLIFRLISKHTIEQKILERATQKRQLEAMIIAKGKFKMPAQAGKQETMTEMATSLLTLEGEKIEVVQSTAAGKASVISDAELDSLLDRRPEVFQGRPEGWTSAGLPKTKDTKKPDASTDGAAFAVYETTQDEGNDALARMLGEDVVDSE